MLHQLLLAYRPSLVKQQVFQYAVFLAGQRDDLAPYLCRPFYRIEGQLPAAQHRVVLHKAAPGQTAHPRLQLLQMKGLDQIVVGAAVQPFHLVADSAAGGENQHTGFPVLLPQRFQQIHAIPSRQVQIQQKQVVLLRQQPVQRGIAVIAGIHLVALLLQAFDKRVAQCPLVLHNQNPHTAPPLRSCDHVQYSISA